MFLQESDLNLERFTLGVLTAIHIGKWRIYFRIEMKIGYNDHGYSECSVIADK